SDLFHRNVVQSDFYHLRISARTPYSQLPPVVCYSCPIRLRRDHPQRESSSSRSNPDRQTEFATQPHSYPRAPRLAHPQSTSLRRESRPTSSWCSRLLGVQRGAS